MHAVLDNACRSGRPKRQCTTAEANSCHKAMKSCDLKDLPTYNIPKEVNSLRRAGPYLIGLQFLPLDTMLARYMLWPSVGMLIPGQSHSWVESHNSRVSIETLDFA